MPRGFFTQSVVLLMERAPSMEAVAAALGDFDVRGHQPERPPATWLGGFPELLVGYRPEDNGLVTVEIIDRRWPDSMGDPRQDPDLFGAWSLGAFGPATFPGNLARAAHRSLGGREGAPRAVEEHRALLRLRLSWVLGAGEGAPLRPEGQRPKGELAFITRVAEAASTLDETLAFFNPGGEVLLEPEHLRERLARATSRGLPALDTFVSVRLATVDDAPGWALMDTVGMDQLELPDHEVVFEQERVDPNDVAGWLMDLCLYTLEAGDVIAPTHTVDGPGGLWRCDGVTEDPRLPAPRRTLQWSPEAATPPSPAR